MLSLRFERRMSKVRFSRLGSGGCNRFLWSRLRNAVAGVTGMCSLLPGPACLASDKERVHLEIRQPHKRPKASIQVDVKLVTVPVTVTDPRGAPVSGLSSDTFRIFEDGVEQQVRYFSSQDEPVSLGIVFDASRSMEDKLVHAQSAVARFCQMAGPRDEFFLVEFNDSPKILSSFTTDTVIIEKALKSIKPKSWTALLDAVYFSIQKLRHGHNARKALLILSDGADNYSRYTESEMKSLVREADVGIYSMGLVGSGFNRRHIGLLRQLSEETGGLIYEVRKVDDLTDAADKISSVMRHQYLLGYSSSNTHNDGIYRKIEVRLNQPTDHPPLRASWRTGYYAPAGE